MARPSTTVLCQVSVHLELVTPFDPERLERQHSGLANLLAELLVGSPQLQRDASELWHFAGLTSLQADLPRLRRHPPLLARLAVALDAGFTALEFDIVGRRVLSVRNLD